MSEPTPVETPRAAYGWPLALLLSLLGCSATEPRPDDASPLGAGQDAQVRDHEGQPVRVLVTGFNDWKELGDPPNVWRCRDNPSCRLLLGEPKNDEPGTDADYDGPLVQRLRAQAPDVQWRFATMPVTWGAASSQPTDVDVIINIGLGVYDRFDALQLEVGAYNLRQGTDAAGIVRAEPIEPAASSSMLAAPDHSPIAAHIEALAGRTIAGYELLAAPARADNSYLCNETHYSALTALHAGAGSLRAVYFLHIPHAESGDYERLADGVAAVVLSLAEPG
jgi:pyrrolidone-carboxylate peptidase